MMKKLLSILLCLCMVVTLLPTVAIPAAAEGTPTKGDNSKMAVTIGGTTTYYDNLAEGWNAAAVAETTATVKLLAGWTADSTNTHSFGTGVGFGDGTKNGKGFILVPANKTITLDLNGQTIDRGLKDTDGIVKGYVIMVLGSLTLNDSGTTGKITGGNNNDTNDAYCGGVYVHDNTTVTTFTMNGGSITGNKVTGSGGGIYGMSKTKIVINGGTISGNTASDDGGGIEGDDVTINGGTISGNIAENGGGVDTTKVTMSNGTVTGNKAKNGGGIWAKDLMLSGGSITGNTANGNGGGVYVDKIFNEDTPTFTMSGGSITGNTATGNGGGVYVASGTTSKVGGGAVVTDNTAGAVGSKTDNNVYLPTGNTITVTDTLTGAIGVTPASYPTVSGTSVTIAESSTGPAHTIDAADATHFFSDAVYGGTSSSFVGYSTTMGTGTDAGKVKITATAAIMKTVKTSGGDYTSLATAIGDLNTGSSGANNGWIIDVQTEQTIAAQISIQKNCTILSSNGSKIIRGSTFTDDALLMVNGTDITVVLRDITIDGGSGSGIAATAPAVRVAAGTLNIGSGAVIQNNNNTFSGQVSDSSNSGGGVCVAGGAFLNMNGGSIKGNATADPFSGGGVDVYGTSGKTATFNMNGGSITNNTSSYGGGVCVDGGGISPGTATFNMNCGSITNNTGRYGGGVCVNSTNGTANFNLSGGSISNNTAESQNDGVYGGGVCVYANPSKTATFNMTGGSITDNSANSAVGAYGGGLEIGTGCTIKLSGKIQISDNTSKIGANSAIADNMYLESGFSPISIASPLANAEPIGVTTQTAPTSGSAVTFTNVNGAGKQSNFSSDNSKYDIVSTAGTGLQLKLKHAVTFANGGGTGADPTQANTIEGGTFPLPANPYTRSGYTFSGWNDGTTTYQAGATYTMPASSVTLTAQWTANGGGSITPTNPTVPVIVDGKIENIGKAETTAAETKVTVDEAELSEKVTAAENGGSVVVPVSDTKANATAQLAVKNVEDMAKKDMTLTVKTGNVSYELPTTAIDTSAVMAELGATDPTKVPVNVTITKEGGVTIEGTTIIVAPTSFTVTATYGGKTVEVARFDSFVQRVIEVTEEQAAKVTTAVVKEADGTIRHVPTFVYQKDGKWYAAINSRTNSVYALIENNVSFADAQGKWYEAAVNEIASRKIVNGKSDSSFDGDGAITRAEFAAMVVRALGLPTDGKSSFSDVASTDWFSGAVGTAVEYGIVSGYTDGTFQPNASITRQGAMAMVQRAAKVAEYPELANAFNVSAYYDDLDAVADWAQSAVTWNLYNGLIKGSDRLVRPTATITRAESATVLLRLLQNAKLVDVRSKV